MSRTAKVFIRPATTFAAVLADIAALLDATPEPIPDDMFRVRGESMLVTVFLHDLEYDGPHLDFPAYPVQVDVDWVRESRDPAVPGDADARELLASRELMVALTGKGHACAHSDDLNDLVPG